MITMSLRGLHNYIVRNEQNKIVGNIKRDGRTKIWDFEGNERDVNVSEMRKINESVDNLNN